MTTIRQERAAELLYQELSILIGNELDDPTLELLAVTNVVVSRDLRVAKVYIHQDSDVQRGAVLARLKRAAPFLRRQLARSVAFRAVPELLFYYDDTPDQAARNRSRADAHVEAALGGDRGAGVAAPDYPFVGRVAAAAGVVPAHQPADEYP